jgi:hypothetical protein
MMQNSVFSLKRGPRPGRSDQRQPDSATKLLDKAGTSPDSISVASKIEFPTGTRIKKLVLRDPVGVPSSCCTTRCVRIYPWRRMRQYRAPLRGQGTSIVGLYWAGCIINMSGFDLRQAQACGSPAAQRPVVGQFDCGRVPDWKTDGPGRIFEG